MDLRSLFFTFSLIFNNLIHVLCIIVLHKVFILKYHLILNNFNSHFVLDDHINNIISYIHLILNFQSLFFMNFKNSWIII